MTEPTMRNEYRSNERTQGSDCPGRESREYRDEVFALDQDDRELGGEG